VALAAYQSLCIDVNDVELMQPFWAAALGLSEHTREDGVSWLDGPTPQHRVWVNEVPEPVTVKQRIHLDLHVAATADVLALGATPDDLDSFRWDVLRDPEGGELCTFTRDVVPAYRLYEVVVDCADAHRVGAWWAEVLGATVRTDGDDAWFDDAPGMPFELVFGTVPEPKTVKNRVHWDVDVPSVEPLLAHGATVLREPDDEVSWWVLADVEGNEFCAFP
jgi:hypothetical protein